MYTQKLWNFIQSQPLNAVYWLFDTYLENKDHSEWAFQGHQVGNVCRQYLYHWNLWMSFAKFKGKPWKLVALAVLSEYLSWQGTLIVEAS